MSLSIKKIKKIENLNIGDIFTKIYEAKTEFESVSYFYQMINLVTPYISETLSPKFKTLTPAINYIMDNYEKSIKVKTLASMCCISEPKFYNDFKEVVGISPIDYKNKLKISKAIDMIFHKITLEKICEDLGYSSPAFLRRQLYKYVRKTPSEIRKGDNIKEGI